MADGFRASGDAAYITSMTQQFEILFDMTYFKSNTVNKRVYSYTTIELVKSNILIDDLTTLHYITILFHVLS